jgi:hypothetical protein
LPFRLIRWPRTAVVQRARLTAKRPQAAQMALELATLIRNPPQTWSCFSAEWAADF